MRNIFTRQENLFNEKLQQFFYMKNKKLFNFISYITIFLININGIDTVRSNENFTNLKSENSTLKNKSLINPLSNYIEKIPSDDFYILGAGDILTLKVSVFTPELNKTFLIDKDGLATLPRLNRVFVSGLTINELTVILNKKYGDFIFDPDVEISIEKYRPIVITIDGEVEDPGIYTLNNNSESNLDQTVFDAIKTAGGITFKANLEEIEITRVNNISNGGGRISTEINLLKAIDLSDTNQNIKIYDGDTIYIKKNPTQVKSQISKVLRSNINNKEINVFISGRIRNPGKITVNKITTLNDAIKFAGGAKLIKGKINFVRFEVDGSMDKRKFRYSPYSLAGDYKNPYLKNGDLIFIGNNSVNNISEFIQDITSPFSGILSSYGLYKAISD